MIQHKALYILDAFPCWSEGFLHQDIRVLLEAGVPLVPVALRRGTGNPDSAPFPVIFLNESPGSMARAPAPGRLQKRLVRLVPRRWRTRLALLRNRAGLTHLCRLVRQQGITHIHAEFADLPGLLAVTAAARSGCSVSLGLHAHDVHVLKYDPARLFATPRFLTVCNTAARDQACRLFPAAAARLHLIHHGLCLEHWPWQPKTAKTAGVPLKLLYAGRLVEKKGVRTLLQALSIARAAGCQWELTILGSGPEAPRLRRQAGRLGIQPWVHWEEAVPRQCISGRLATVDSLVMPSIVARNGDRDGIPNIVLEAMATGTPVVGTSAGGLPEVLDETTGWVAAPGSAAALVRQLQQLEARPAAAGTRCRQARTRIESEFDAKRLVRRRAALFMDALAGVAVEPPNLRHLALPGATHPSGCGSRND